MRLILTSLLALSALTACGPEVQVASRQENRTCPTTMFVASPTGSACESPQSCTEVCCITACPNRDKHFSAQACVDGSCANQQVACEQAAAQNPSLCAN